MEKLKNLIHKIKPEIDFMATRDYIQTGILDSFDIILLVSGIDEIYNISISGFDIVPENFTNLETIYNLIAKYSEQT